MDNTDKRNALLKMKHDEINLNDLQCNGDILWNSTAQEARTVSVNALKYVVAQAVTIDQLATRLEDIVTRDIYPDMDFLDIDGNKIQFRDWFQSWMSGRVQYKRIRPNVAMIVYGVKNMGKGCKTASLDFSHSGTYCSLRSLTPLDDETDTIIFQAPIMIKKDDIMIIEFNPKHDASGNDEDRLALLGIVAGKKEFVY